MVSTLTRTTLTQQLLAILLSRVPRARLLGNGDFAVHRWWWTRPKPGGQPARHRVRAAWPSKDAPKPSGQPARRRAARQERLMNDRPKHGGQPAQHRAGAARPIKDKPKPGGQLARRRAIAAWQFKDKCASSTSQHRPATKTTLQKRIPVQNWLVSFQPTCEQPGPESFELHAVSSHHLPDKTSISSRERWCQPCRQVHQR